MTHNLNYYFPVTVGECPTNDGDGTLKVGLCTLFVSQRKCNGRPPHFMWSGKLAKFMMKRKTKSMLIWTLKSEKQIKRFSVKIGAKKASCLITILPRFWYVVLGLICRFLNFSNRKAWYLLAC